MTDGLRHIIKSNAISLAIAITIASALFFWYLIEEKTGVYVLNYIEAKLTDQRQRRRRPRPPGDEVVIVAIDAKSSEKIGRWPWSRTTHAALIDRLREWGASTVAFDVLFSESEGVREARRLRQIAATLPAGDELDATREAIQTALTEIEVDKSFADALARTYDDDRALTVLAYDFVFLEDLGHMGQLGAVLNEQGEQIVLDIGSFSTRNENVAVMRTAPPKLALGIRPVITELAEWAAALGFVNPVFDSDGALRREQLVVVYSPAVRKAMAEQRSASEAIADPEARVQAYMSLATAAVATHLRLRSDELVLDLGAGELRFPGPDGKERVHFFDPFDGTALIDFCGRSQTFPTYSFVDVLNDELVDADGNAVAGPEAFKDRLVFVGATDQGLGDFFVTPFTARLPGVEKHANVAENLLHGRQLRTHRDHILVVGITCLAIALLAALLTANLGPLVAGGGMAVAAIGYLYWTLQDFINNGVIWNWTVPLTTLIFTYAGVTAYRTAVERKAKRAMTQRSAFIKETFGRYLSDQVVDLLVDNPEGLSLGGERRRITIMMSDLRGFTSLCERSNPEAIVSLLNLYLGRMTEIIFKYGGTIDEFIGDAILALFGAPVAKEDDAQRAVACAIEMQIVMEEVKAILAERDLPPAEMGIALNTGEVIVGNIGSEMRTKYGVVGSNINLTARIEGLTVGGQVFISEQTLDEIGRDLVTTGARVDVKAKGLSEPVGAYEVHGIGAPFNLEMPRVTEDFVDLDTPIPVEIIVLEGKQLSEESEAGQLCRLSQLSADLECSQTLAVHDNIKLKLNGPDAEGISEDLYAKVIDRPAAPGRVALRFTSVPPEIGAYLDRRRKASS